MKLGPGFTLVNKIVPKYDKAVRGLNKNIPETINSLQKTKTWNCV